VKKALFLIFVLGILLFYIPRINAITDADIQNGCVLYYVMNNDASNIQGTNVRDWSNNRNGTIDADGLSCTATFCTFAAGTEIDFTAWSSQTQTFLIVANYSEVLTSHYANFLDSDSQINAAIAFNYPDHHEFGTFNTQAGKSTHIGLVNVLYSTILTQNGGTVAFYNYTTNITSDSIIAAANITSAQIGGTTITALGQRFIAGIWERVLSNEEITYLSQQITLNTSYNPFLSGGGGTTPTIDFNINTTSTGTYYNETQKNIYASVTTTNLPGHNTTTINIYNTTGLYASTTTTTELNYSYNFTNLPPETYYLNATASNGTEIKTATRTIKIYSFKTNITNPTNNTNTNRTINITYTDTITPTGAATISGHNISILNQNESLNFTINSNTNTTPYNYDLYSQNLTIGTYKINIISTDNNSNQKSDTKTFNLIRDATLNITTTYIIGNITVSNFTINITDETTNTTETYTTTTNKTTNYIIRNRNYTITIDATGYAITNTTHISFTNTTNNYTIYIYTENSVYINIYDESDLSLINDTTVSITFVNNDTALVYSTNNGTYYKDALTDGEWSVRFYSANYSYRTYTITVANRSTQTLNAYLTPSTYTTIFTIRDSQTLTILQDVSFTIERLSNATYIIVESKFSDISGAIQFGYLPGIEYRFTLVKTGYSSKVFSLNPVLFSSYNIYLDRTVSLNNTLDYGLVSIIYYPRYFINNVGNALTLQFSSPQGVLSSYAFSIVAPGGYNRTNGSLANGESFILRFNITNATLFDRVNVTYNYTSTTAGFKHYFIQYEIIGSGVNGNYTIAGLRNKDYGMGAFEKVFLITLSLVLICGFTYLIAGMGGAIVSGLLTMGVGVYLGFLPLWSVIISFVTGIIILVAVSIGGNK
jgi:hypothetical protein